LLWLTEAGVGLFGLSLLSVLLIYPVKQLWELSLWGYPGYEGACWIMIFAWGAFVGWIVTKLSRWHDYL
jgi:hypothetical protein